MNGKNCRATRLEIDQSELGQHLSDQVLQHLASCPPCSEFRAQRASLRELVGGLEPVVAPADFDVQLRARIAREKENSARRPFIFRYVISTPAIALAALLVMIVGTIVWVSQRNRISTVASTTSARPATTVAEKPSISVNSAGAPIADVASSSMTDNQKPTGRLNSARQNVGKSSPLADSGLQTSDFGVSRAAAVRQLEQKPGEVSLSAPVKPMVVSMQDDQGAKRRILLPPISFGSQRLDNNRIPVSATNVRDW